MYRLFLVVLAAPLILFRHANCVIVSPNVVGVKPDARVGARAGPDHSSPGTSIPSIEAQKRLQSVQQRDQASVALEDMLSAIETMQDTYFDVYDGTWPDAIDWTAAVMGTHISATLSTLVQGLHGGSQAEIRCADLLSYENTISKYFFQTSLFYFGENALALRGQAFDDMLWVVLGWLENVKFAEMYSAKHWDNRQTQWHGVQMKASAAHRARIFYDLAAVGWDTKLCGGGMVWNPALEPYKNAITNELYAAASIGMYLYSPGDNNTAPFVTDQSGQAVITKPHDPVHLENAIKAYKWLRESGMQNSRALYQDGFHVSGWNRRRNGTIDPGTGKCDSLNTMVYTYNQGVILSASRGLWLATGAKSYIQDGHYLISGVINATGWPATDKSWHGLGRGGVFEEFCDRWGFCSQDGQTFKGIFFHHLSEFCRPLWPQEEKFLVSAAAQTEFDTDVYEHHLAQCASYGTWIEHNAKAALQTKDEHGLFGMWWGVPARSNGASDENHGQQDLPSGARDYKNPLPSGLLTYNGRDLNRRGRGRTVETQSGGLAVLRAHFLWLSHLQTSSH